MLDAPIRGISLPVEGSVLLIISSITETDRSKVTLKATLSAAFESTKKEITSSTSKKHDGIIMFMTYSTGLLFISICNGERENNLNPNVLKILH